MAAGKHTWAIGPSQRSWGKVAPCFALSRGEACRAQDIYCRNYEAINVDVVDGMKKAGSPRWGGRCQSRTELDDRQIGPRGRKRRARV